MAEDQGIAQRAAGDRRVHPISPEQERLWFLEQLDPGSAAIFVFPVEIELTGPISLDALNRAVAAVVERHPPLRLAVEQGDNEIVLVERPWPPSLSVIDRTTTDAATSLPALRLKKGRLFAAQLVRLGPRRHVLQFAVHHMVFDLASIRILVDELSTAYAAAGDSADPLSALPPLPLSYFEVATHQTLWADSVEGLVALASCQLALEGVTDLDLATDRPRTGSLSFESASEHFSLGSALATEIVRFSDSFMVTPFITLCAAFGVAISRRAGGNRDFAVAVPYRVRVSDDTTRLIGLLSNMTPLRIRLPYGCSFVELVRSIRDETARVLDDGRVPFDRVVAELRPRRDLSRMPLCPVSFQKNYDVEPANAGGDVTFRRVHADRATSQFELSVSVGSDADLGVLIEYSTELFDRDTVRQIGAEFRTMCAHLVAHPHRPIDDADQHGDHLPALLALSRATTEARPAPVPAVFAERAAAAPDAVAVSGSGGSLTYGELDTAANELAERLCAAGVRRGDVVAVLTGRDVNLPVALLGVLRAGAAYLPLDEELPRPRREAMLALAASSVAVTDGTGADIAEAHGLRAIPARIDRPDGEYDGELPTLTADDLAYVLFTSGTTGAPKAVAVTHGGVTTLATGASYLRPVSSDVVALLAPVQFDASTFELWTALLSGARLAIAPDSRPSPAELHRFVTGERVTVLHLTSGLMRVVADERPEVFAGLRQLLTGGDVVSGGHLRQIAQRYPRLALTACYGPTEITTFASVADDATLRAAMAAGTAVPIGRPVAGRTLLVADGEGRPVATGVTGEILVGGHGLARGYLAEPGLTSARFVPHPYEAGARLYRTGDLGRMDSTGVVWFRGRADRQLKIRGFRVEPAEVEAVLAEQPEVRDCVVRPRRMAGELGLVGYVVADGTVDEEVLQARLTQRLPLPSRPARLLLLPSLPVTAQGKVDGAALDALNPHPNSGGADDPAESSAPPDPLIATVLAAWRSILGQPDIDVDADFFELGGHSLAALRMAGRLERELDRLVPVNMVFDAPTVRSFAAALRVSGIPRPAQIRTGGSDDELLAELTGADPGEIAAFVRSLATRDQTRDGQ